MFVPYPEKAFPVVPEGIDVLQCGSRGEKALLRGLVSVKERSSVIGGSGSLNIYTGSNRDTKGRKGYSRYMRINTRCIYNI